MTTPANRALPDDLKLETIRQINIEQATMITTVQASCRVAASDYQVFIEELIPISEDEELLKAVILLENLIRDRLQVPNKIDRDPKCDHCNAVCCTTYSHIPVFEEDLPGLMRAVGVDSLQALKEKNIVQGEPMMSQIGWLGRVKIEDEETEALLNTSHMCTFLTWNSYGVGRCGIYENRPSTCRDYKELTCSMQQTPNSRLYRIRKHNPKQKPSDKAIKDKPVFDVVAFLRHKPLELGTGSGG